MSGKSVAIVLAAGKGTRMHSSLAKVLHPVLGQPMVCYPVGAAFEAGVDRVVVVVGHQGDAVRTVLKETFPTQDLQFAEQTRMLGTADAVQCGLDATEGYERVLILCGDTPALDATTLLRLIERHAENGAALTLSSFEAADPTGYGRVIRDLRGQAMRIVEHADASPEERGLKEVNAGLYLVQREDLAHALQEVGNTNVQGEFYLTDIVATLDGASKKIGVMKLPNPATVAGVNTRVQLSALEEILRRDRNRALMEAGVSIEEPRSVRIESGVRVGRETRVGRGVQLRGRTVVGEGCTIEAGSHLTDCVLGDKVHVKPYVVATEATLGDGCAVGPFAHLRPGTRLGARAKVGNFVETKKATLGAGSKASHLSYLGDCDIGADVNIGAGTITCNYDGFEKHQTVLEDGVFVGSDTQFVAPVHVGKNATVGAGTTVTGNVPEGALVVSRTPQRVIDGYYESRRRPRAEAQARAKAKDSAKEG